MIHTILIDAEEIAKVLLEKGKRSTDRNIEDRITDVILDHLTEYINDNMYEVLYKMQELEHPEPRNKAEYDEKYGIGE